MGILVLAVEGMPQLLILAMVMTHWHGDFNVSALSFFVSFIDIPLILWYLSFYCNERTKYAVIGKIINLAIENSAGEWVDLVETYIYNEKEEIEKDSAWGEKSTDTGKGYDVSSPWKIICYQTAYFLASPIIGKMEAILLLKRLCLNLFMPRSWRNILCS